jgi:SAM-dependent methyltransferase
LFKRSSVRSHYEHWPFPGTDFLSKEGLLLLRYMDKWINQERQSVSEKVCVIDVGCGTGHTTRALAKNFPDASFLGIDLSKTSIQTARFQTKKTKLLNATFKTYDLRNDLSPLGEFEIVLCLGVLHHIEDSNKALRNIVQLIKPNGYCVLWLYGRLGRFQHNMNQEFLRLLTKKREKDEILEIARSFLEELGSRFAKGTGFYTPKGSEEEGLSWLLDHQEWMADQMIPAFEHGFSLQEILSLFQENRLTFWKWLGIPYHLKKFTSSAMLLESFEKLSHRERLLAMDYLIKPSYYFVVGKRAKAD